MKKVVPGKPIELHIPYKEEGVLFQRGKDTHNAKGRPMRTDGSSAEDWDFEIHERKMETEGEEEFLKSVAISKVENHLVPIYRKKFNELKMAKQLPVNDEKEPTAPELPTGFKDVEIPF
jgi:hypothetical protein